MKISLKGRSYRLALIAMAVASLGQAITIVQNPTFGFTGATTNGVGTIDGTTSSGGQYLSLFTGADGVTFTDQSNQLTSLSLDTLTLSWFGTITNNNSFDTSTPLIWLFSLRVSDSDSLGSLAWSLNALENGSNVYSNLNNSWVSNPIQGSSSFLVPANSTVSLEVDLSATFNALFSGDSLTVTVPQSGTINAGVNSVPEPASFGFAAAGLIGLLGFARSRRRS
jgi:MYXO-CTERM domain-containing protein